ncbi:MAG: reverse transcriptase/maturase family protein [Nitrosopumilus sp.]|nr:reverse transcriptase/maturase family protein [Nitrosopumilus sp.]
MFENIMNLNYDLKTKTYQHSSYEHFKINDPKPRDIYKASVRDRLLHHAIYRALYPYFDTKFIHNSYSCRKNKGTHKALIAFNKMARKVGKNHTKTVWVLKCDIKKFFARIDHNILKQILAKHITDDNILWLLEQVIDSFPSILKSDFDIGGLPLGNLTSQLLVNIYMNEFDQWVKHKLKAKHYIRYADDFVFLHEDKKILEKYLQQVHIFLEEKLKLELHPNKISITTFASGVDFLGWVHFTDHRVLRTVTKRRMMKNIMQKQGKEEVVQSYLGMLSHGDGYKLMKEIKKITDG